MSAPTPVCAEIAECHGPGGPHHWKIHFCEHSIVAVGSDGRSATGLGIDTRRRPFGLLGTFLDGAPQSPDGPRCRARALRSSDRRSGFSTSVGLPVPGAPQYALAYAHLGLAYFVQPFWSPVAPDRVSQSAKEAIDRAFELDPNLPEAYAARANWKAYFEWDWRGAEADLARVSQRLGPLPRRGRVGGALWTGRPTPSKNPVLRALDHSARARQPGPWNDL